MSCQGITRLWQWITPHVPADKVVAGSQPFLLIDLDQRISGDVHEAFGELFAIVA
jgi:hypothetical protein